MLDIKTIRENAPLVRRGAQLKNIPVDLDKILDLDQQRRHAQQELQDLQTQQNRISREVGPLAGRIKTEPDPEKKAALQREFEAMKARPAALKAQRAALEQTVKALDEQIDQLLLTVPLPPDADVPIGKSSDDNVQMRQWGAIRNFEFTPKSHIELGESLGLFDAHRGVKIAGSRSYFLIGAGALLHSAVLRLAMDMMVHEKMFSPMAVPVMVREAAMRGTGFFPAGREQAYRVGDVNEAAELERFLTGTGEVALTAFHMDEILDEASLPRKYVTLSTCFRREAGTYGKDTAGLYRIHQFDKVEQVVLCRNDVGESRDWHAKMLSYSEEILQRLNLPYRLMQCCTGDLGPKNAAMIDIETWMPSRNAFGETHSASRLYDFQARRCNLRYRDAQGQVHFCHTLNNTVVASPRILIPILELYQNSDGSVTVPPGLRPYMAGMERIEKK